jgi:hypothetical protein
LRLFKILRFYAIILAVIILSSAYDVQGLLLAETPLQLYQNSDVILIGKVTSREKTGNFTQEYHYDIQVEEYIKNKQHDTIIDATAMASADSSLPIFNAGDRVLFVLDKESGNYFVSPESFKTVPGCTSHQMLGFRLFPDEPLTDDMSKAEFKIDKGCLGPLVQINPSDDVFFSPLKQFKGGTDPKDIACKEGSVLVLNPQSGLPACVKPDTASRLAARGWLPGPVNKITGGPDAIYYTGQRIDFIVTFQGFVKSCDYPHITIHDSNGKTIFSSNALALLCDPDMGRSPVYVTQWYRFGAGLGGPIAINDTGNYTMDVSWYDQSVKKDFTVIAGPSGKSWVEMDPVQCPAQAGTGMAYWNSTHTNATYPIGLPEDPEGIINFFFSKGIQIFDLKKDSWGDVGICGACGCPLGYTIELLVSNSDLEKIQKFGFDQLTIKKP